MPATHKRRIAIIGAQFGGADGISELGRQIVRGVAAAVGPSTAIGVHSLLDETTPPAFDHLRVRMQRADGSRLRLVLNVLRATVSMGGDDLVIVTHAHFLPLALPALIRGSALAVVLVGIEVWRPLSRLQRSALARAQHVVAISQHTIDRFEAANPNAVTQRIHVCHPAVPDSVAGGSSMLQPGYALMVGRIAREERYKGHDDVIEAWPQVRAACPSARLVIVGDGDDRQRLEQKASALHLGDAIHFTGRVDAARLQGLYADAAFFVMPSRDEGFGFVYLEAMRAGKPCIACPGAAAEIIEDGRNGLLVAFGDTSNIAGACVRLFNDPMAREQLGRAASEAIEQQFVRQRFDHQLALALGLDSPPRVHIQQDACA